MDVIRDLFKSLLSLESFSIDVCVVDGIGWGAWYFGVVSGSVVHPTTVGSAA